MSVPAPNWSSHQLTEFLAKLYGCGDELSACLLAVERVAEGLDAEIGAFVRHGEVLCSIGFPHGKAPTEDLAALAAGATDGLMVEGLGACRAISVQVDDGEGGAVVVARFGQERFLADETGLAQGVARVLALTLRVIRVAEAERLQREEAQAQTLLNQQLIEALEERRALLERLSGLQRSIAHSSGRERVFEAIVTSACELLGDDVATLALIDPDRAESLKIVATIGQGAFGVGDAIPMDNSVPGRAAARGRPFVDEDFHVNSRSRGARLGNLGHGDAATGLQRLREDGMRAIISVPVHERGRVVGSLTVGSMREGRHFTMAEREILAAFAEHASLALTDTLRIEAGRARTERQVEERYEARLHQAQRLESVGQLAGGIAHDFNNLLVVILNYASFVLDALDADHPARADAHEIAKAAQRASELTKQLLVFSRRGVVHAQVVDLVAILSDVESLLRRTLGENVEVSTEVSSVPNVEADPTQVEQVLLNLAVNARDAMPDGGSLSIAFAGVELESDAAQEADLPPGRYARLTVTDTGRGMTEEALEHAFEPFFTTKPKGQGTGLGLATVYGIVKQAHGAIAIESAPGEGTRVTVDLPATAKEAEGGRDPKRIAAGNGGPATILVVEDEDAVRDLACRILSSNGYSVVEAAGGEGALEMWEERGDEIDLLLTDLVMPSMSGVELAEHLARRRPGLARLFMSGYTDDVTAQHGLGGTSTQLVEKPFDAEQLLTAVAQSLDGGSSSDQTSGG
jgi:signal transduction histidine kinase/ActR/RegA family two-component response regulator